MVTTKYTKKRGWDRNYSGRNDKVVIGNSSDDQVKEYICPNCFTIKYTRLTEGELICNCSNTIEIQEVRRKSKLETPHKNTETLIADPRTIYGGNNPAKNVSIHHEPELKGGFLALSQKGLRIKNYREDKPA